jgi:lipoprotein-anchoring transpeptidase ErfK/SrfK
MSVRTPTSASARRRTALAAVAVLATAGLAACDAAPGVSPSDDAAVPEVAEERIPPLRLRTNLDETDAVPVDQQVQVRAAGGDLTSVTVSSAAGPLAGKVVKGAWRSSGRLEPGTDYVVRGVGRRTDGSTQRRELTFHTADLTLDQQTYAAVAPLEGETVGVGMPVIVHFDVPVTDRASIEKHMSVTATPRQQGSWHWISSTEVHWRPRTYWKAGSDVSVDVDINSVPAAAGIYGQESRHVDFHIGDAHVYKVSAVTHQMKVFSNGKLLRTIPITTGEQPKYTTRSGVKIIVEKYRKKRMNSETVGISRDDPEAYDIDDVEYAMRVTYSGEFLHAAPWSVTSQGNANVSHGCTGMSTSNAAWLYSVSKPGDVVEYTGTDRPMEFTNGYGDWNASFADYSAGSALS